MKDIEFFRSTIEGYTGIDFTENLERICAEMHNELNILTFGIIVYDESSPELRKILRDQYYWEALDKASGDRMVIFTLVDKAERVLLVEHRQHDQTSKPLDRLDIMFAFSPTKSNDLGENYSYILDKLFGKKSDLVYPSVIFFQVYADSIFDYTLVPLPLQRRSPWESAEAIQALFGSVSRVLNNILPDYLLVRRSDGISYAARGSTILFCQ